MNHELKIKPCYYEATARGDKRFEIRTNDDRGFQKGDMVYLVPVTDLGIKIQDKPILVVRITYVTNFMQKDGYVVFGHEPIKEAI